MFLKKISMLALLSASVLTLSACQSTTASNAAKWESTGANDGVYYNQNAISTPAENTSWRSIQLLTHADGANLTDANTPSLVFDVTVDCAQKAMRFNRIDIYTQPYGKGEVSETKTGAPTFFEASSASELAMVAAVCQ